MRNLPRFHIETETLKKALNKKAGFFDYFFKSYPEYQGKEEEYSNEILLRKQVLERLPTSLTDTENAIKKLPIEKIYNELKNEIIVFFDGIQNSGKKEITFEDNRLLGQYLTAVTFVSALSKVYKNKEMTNDFTRKGCAALSAIYRTSGLVADILYRKIESIWLNVFKNL